MKQSVTSLFRLYLARSDLRPASVRFKLQALRYFVEWFGRDSPDPDDPKADRILDLEIGSVTEAIAEDYRSLLVAPKPGGRGLSKRSANGYLANFKPFWEWCRRHGRVTVSPFESVNLFKITRQQRQTFTPAELGRLLLVASPMWQMRICIGLLGDRRGEMLATVVSDVHLDEPQPYMLLSEKQATATTYPWGIKDYAARYVALPEVMEFEGITIELHRLIRERITALPANQPYLFIEDQRARRAVNKKRNEPRDVAGNFQRSFRALQHRASITPTKRFHELRAAFATQMIRCYGILAAADALGHASIQTTRGYDRTSVMSLVQNASLMAAKCYKTVS